MTAINNNITEAYCSLDSGRLLKKYGCRILSPYSYYNGKFSENQPQYEFPDDEEKYLNIDRVFAPRHDLIIEWIYENFTYEVIVQHRSFFTHEYIIQRRGNYSSKIKSETDFATRSEAREAAILFALQNLIK